MSQSHRPSQLNARQLLFVDAIVLGKTQRDAAIAAGYSPSRADSTASNLASNRKIIAAIAEKRAKVAIRIDKTADDIARAMWGIINDPDAPHSARVSAAALEARRFRVYSDKHEVESVNLNIDVVIGKDLDDRDA